MVELIWGVPWDEYANNPGTNQTFLVNAMNRGIGWASWQRSQPSRVSEALIHGQLFEESLEAAHTGNLDGSYMVASVDGFSTKKNREIAGAAAGVAAGSSYQDLYESGLAKGRRIVSRYMWDSTAVMIDRCTGEPVVADLLLNRSAQYQGVVSGSLDGCGLFKGRIDVGIPTSALSEMTRMVLGAHNPGFFNESSFTLVDIKTTADASPHKNGFPKSAGKYDYFFQLAFYSRLLREALGVEVNPVIVAVEKPEPSRMPIHSEDVNVVVYPLGTDCLERLDRRVSRAIQLNRDWLDGVAIRGFNLVNALVPPAYYPWGD